MPTQTNRFEVQTQGNNHVLNITDAVAQAVDRAGLTSGVATVLVVGSTAGISTTEYEPGLADHDLADAFEGIAPEDGTYVHEQTWHDDNGHSHVRATLLGPSITVPVVYGRLTLGTWQQIILIDFDTRPRRCEIIVQTLGEAQS